MIKAITVKNHYLLNSNNGHGDIGHDKIVSADIAFIGSGIACTVTLTSLFEKLLATKPNKTLQIIVIENHHEFWKGIPYGSRSSVNGLTITTASDFFTNAEEHQQFFHWFTEHLDYFITEFKKRGGEAANIWFTSNSEALTAHDWEGIYLPRFIIGEYLEQKFLALKKNVEDLKLVSLETISGNAIDLNHGDSRYKIKIAANNTTCFVNAGKVVLSIGSAPETRLTNAFDHSDDVTYIDKIYDPSMDDNISLLRSKMASLIIDQRNILIVGTNASTIELLYIIANTRAILQMVNNITLLSISGKLPAEISYKRNDLEVNTNLTTLEKNGSYTIEMLVEAASEDITSIAGADVSVPDVDIIIGQTLMLLNNLSENDKKLFYGIHGVQLAKLFRRSGTDYKIASNTLTQSGKLDILRGKFVAINLIDSVAELTYLDIEAQQEVKLARRFKIVINNTGAEDLLLSPSPLIQSLINNIHTKVNYSGKAFEVNEKLEAAPNLYIIGPLVGGNYNKLLKFWHLENASRIIYLAPYLANELISE